jgi:hypothetical protein
MRADPRPLVLQLLDQVAEVARAGGGAAQPVGDAQVDGALGERVEDGGGPAVQLQDAASSSGSCRWCGMQHLAEAVDVEAPAR